MYDTLYNTENTLPNIDKKKHRTGIEAGESIPELVQEWQNVVIHHGINRVPDKSGIDNNYFNLDYIIKPIGE